MTTSPPKLLAIVLLAGAPLACRPPTPPERIVSAAGLDSLPQLVVSEGHQVCEAAGSTPCPLDQAVANWIDSDRFALWEPGRLVQLFGGKDTAGVAVGEIGLNPGEYRVAVAVGPDRDGVAVIDGERSMLVRYDATGKFRTEKLIPRPDVSAAPGYAGAVPVMQAVRSSREGGPAQLQVRVLKAPGDTAGRVVLDRLLPWLPLQSGRPLKPAPFFPPIPRYAIDSHGGIVWSPADSFRIERRARNGSQEWVLSSGRGGPPISPEDIATRRAELESQNDPSILPHSRIDSMIAATAVLHPAVSGLILSPSGPLLVVGPVVPSRDSVDYLVVSAEGIPQSRFKLPAKTHVLLFRDSLLVHRPTEGEPWEVRWLQLSPHP